MRKAVFTLLITCIIHAGSYPSNPKLPWLSDSFDELFDGKITQYDREQAMVEFVRRYEWFVEKSNNKRATGELRTTLHMADYNTARGYLIESFLKVGLKEEVWEHFDFTRTMMKDTYLEIRTIQHMVMNMTYLSMNADEESNNKINLLEQAVNHPEFLNYDNPTEIGLHINMLGMLAAEHDRLNPLDSLIPYEHYFEAGIEYGKFDTTNFHSM